MKAMCMRIFTVALFRVGKIYLTTRMAEKPLTMRIPNAGKCVYIANGNTKYYSHFGNQFGNCFLSQTYTYHTIPLLSVYPRQIKAYVHTKRLCAITADLFIIAPNGNDPLSSAW